ncbi:MAG: V4R domain-containing protein [Promethearchaeota archaeon]
MPNWFKKKKRHPDKEVGVLDVKPDFNEDFGKNKVQTVDVVPEHEAYFLKAEREVMKYFKDIRWDPSKGTISIGRNSYILLNAESFQKISEDLSHDLDISIERANFLYYKLAKTVGRSDARRFIYETGVTEPIAKLSCGPVYFAFTGNARVKFLESNITQDENFVIRYEHPHSFESDEFIRRNGPISKRPVCYWNAGYSAGWCSEAFSLDLDSREISCRAMNHDRCRFIMAQSDLLEQRVKESLEQGF